MSDINMTPLIDVMLVLLVIFMLTAPLMTSSLKLDLPKADATPSNAPPKVLSIALSASGQTYLDEVIVTPQALAQKAAEVGRERPETEVQLRADQSVPYGRVAELIGQLQKAGLNRVAFITQAAPGMTADPAGQGPSSLPSKQPAPPSPVRP